MVNLSNYQYADIREVKEISTVIRIKDDEIKLRNGEKEGVSIRILKNGSWGFASGRNLEELAKKAEKLAGIVKGNTRLPEIKPIKERITAKKDDLSIEEKVKILLDAKKEMTQKEITNRIVGLTEKFIIKKFYSSEGSEIIQEQAYSYLSVQAIGRNEQVQIAHQRKSSVEGFDKINPYKVAQDASKKLKRILNASLPHKGKFTVVFDPEMTGVLSHEAVGHACEGDSIVKGESILRGKVGEKIGNEIVTIADDPTAKDFGFYFYDDDGVKGKRTTLIEEGILKNYLLSRGTAQKLGMEVNGHARADGYDAFPIVRMSNTYFQPGKSSKEDVFDIKNGIYLVGMRGGSVDTVSGGFMFKAEEAFEIENGEPGKALRDVTIIGNVLEVMKNVEVVGKDFATSPGICGKNGQEAPVSDGGPHIQVKGVSIG